MKKLPCPCMTNTMQYHIQQKKKLLYNAIALPRSKQAGRPPNAYTDFHKLVISHPVKNHGEGYH